MAFKNVKEKQDALECLFYEFHMFIEMFKRVDPPNSDQLMANATLESWLLHARNLLVMFETPITKRYKDDILSADFDFPDKPIPTGDLDRDRLHKDLAHITLDRLTRKDKPEKAWQLSWFVPILHRISKFLDHIIGDADSLSPQKAEAEKYKSDIAELLAQIAATPSHSTGATGMAG